MKRRKEKELKEEAEANFHITLCTNRQNYESKEKGSVTYLKEVKD